MIKKVIGIILLCATITIGKAQVYTPINTYGQRHFRIKVDSVLTIPNDTISNVFIGSIARKNSKLYLRNVQKWDELGGISLDTNRIAFKDKENIFQYSNTFNETSYFNQEAIFKNNKLIQYGPNNLGAFYINYQDNNYTGQTRLTFPYVNHTASDTVAYRAWTLNLVANSNSNLTFNNPLSINSNAVSIAQATGSTNGFLTSADWLGFDGKQNALNGTGLVRMTGTTVAYDNNNYALASNIPTAANPTATLGLTAINGTATTFMRSDAAPALNVGIAPTWTGLHTYSRSLSGTEIALGLNITSITGTTARIFDVNLGVNNLVNVNGINGGNLYFNSPDVGNSTNPIRFSIGGTLTAAINALGIRANRIVPFDGQTLNITTNANGAGTTQHVVIGNYGTLNQVTGSNILTISNTFATQQGAINNIINLTPTINLDASTTSLSTFTPIFYGPNIQNLRTAQHRFINATHGDVLIGTTSGSLKVGGGTTVNAKAIAEFTSTNQGILPPRMTATQASAIAVNAADEGLMIYVTNTNATFTSKGWWGFNGATWEKLNN
jgi:hypothetical protein